jgi:PKD repeat protein
VFATTTISHRRLARPMLAALLALAALALLPGRADALTASFTTTPAAPRTGQAVTLSATATPDAGEAITGFSWDFGDGSAAATGATVTHTFPAGAWTVTLTVSEDPIPPATAPAAASTTVSRAITANTPPVARFTWTPAFPIAGAGVTFTSASADSDGTIVSYSWDLDGDGIFGDGGFTGPTATATILRNTNVSLRVTDNLGGTSTVRRPVVINTPPVASFTVNPANPLVGQTVTFTSTSKDADRGDSIVSSEWDLTGNGQFSDATGTTARKVFTVPGDAIVRLRVTDSRGASSIAAVTIPVSGPPVASFDVSASPTAGHPVTFTSTSHVTGGAVANLQWDLDGDGQFNDAAGETATHTYATPGSYTVSLRVTDTGGRTNVAFRSITVRAEPSVSGAAAPRAPAARPAQFLLPFPIVRIAGRVTGRSTHISLLEVRAPSGARIRVKCAGRGCPKTDLTAIAQSRPTRFRKMRRTLRAGSVIRVFVRANGRIGKYTRFRIRRARPPLRRDMCLPPTRRGPAPCTG